MINGPDGEDRPVFYFYPMDKSYWTQRYAEKKTGWDIGYPSTPIVAYFNHYDERAKRILVPGAGNAYEAEHLWNEGHKELHVCDLSKLPLDNFKSRCPSFPPDQLIEGDFFKLTDTYDIIVEQTFFCALPRDYRQQYVQQCHRMLQEDGYIVGLLFNKEIVADGPPFGGSIEEYLELFAPYFDIAIMEDCHNSIPPRKGNELFIKLIKKSISDH